MAVGRMFVSNVGMVENVKVSIRVDIQLGILKMNGLVLSVRISILWPLPVAFKGRDLTDCRPWPCNIVGLFQDTVVASAANNVDGPIFLTFDNKGSRIVTSPQRMIEQWCPWSMNRGCQVYGASLVL